MVGAWPAHVPAIASLVPRSFSLKKELGGDREPAATQEFYSKLPYIYIYREREREYIQGY